MHEDVCAAAPLHQIEDAGLLEKTRKIPWCMYAQGKHDPQNVVLDHVQSAVPEKDDHIHGKKEA